MISQLSAFKLLDRGFNRLLLLIPGWATDYEIFRNIDLRYNYVLPTRCNPFTFESELLRWLEKSAVDTVSLFGWSLGGFLACDFASKNPNRIDTLILVSICKRFLPKEIDGVRMKLRKNKRAYLFKFYLECFSPTDTEGFTWFKEHLLKRYIEQTDLNGLMGGLDYLWQARINPDALRHIQNIRIFHGKEDTIAPLKEAKDISAMLPQSQFYCLPGLGHIPFINHIFKEQCNSG